MKNKRGSKNVINEHLRKRSRSSPSLKSQTLARNLRKRPTKIPTWALDLGWLLIEICLRRWSTFFSLSHVSSFQFSWSTTRLMDIKTCLVLKTNQFTLTFQSALLVIQVRSVIWKRYRLILHFLSSHAPTVTWPRFTPVELELIPNTRLIMISALSRTRIILTMNQRWTILSARHIWIGALSESISFKNALERVAATLISQRF